MRMFCAKNFSGEIGHFAGKWANTSIIFDYLSMSKCSPNIEGMSSLAIVMFLNKSLNQMFQ